MLNFVGLGLIKDVVDGNVVFQDFRQPFLMFDQFVLFKCSNDILICRFDRITIYRILLLGDIVVDQDKVILQRSRVISGGVIAFVLISIIEGKDTSFVDVIQEGGSYFSIVIEVSCLGGI